MRCALLVNGAVAMGACTLTTPLDDLTGGQRDASAPDVTSSEGGAGDAPGPPPDGPAPKDDGPLPSRYRDMVVGDAPVVYYRLGDTGGTAKDEMGGHNGTVIGTIAHGPGAIVGDPDGAFVGTGQGWIDIAQIVPFTGNAVYSLEAWIAPKQSSTLTGVVSRNLAKPGSTPDDGYSLYIETNLAPILGRWLSGNEQSAAAPPLSASAFTHVVGVYDGSTLRLYVNGALAGSGPSTQALIAPPTDLAIGATRNGTYGYFVGSLDEVAVYDKALAPERIAAHYMTGLGM